MKNIKKLLMVFVAMILLTGCMKMNVNLTVKSKDEMTMSMEMLMSPLLTQDMEVDDLAAQMKEEMKVSGNIPEENIEIKNIEKDVDGSKWKGVSINIEVPKEEVKKILTEENGKLTLKADSSNGSDLTSSLGQYDEEQIKQAKQSGVEFNMSITMPGKPTTNIGTVNGNTVTIDLLSEEAQKVTTDGLIISCSTNGGGVPIIAIVAIVAAVVVIAGVAIILSKKKKKLVDNYVPNSNDDNSLFGEDHQTNVDSSNEAE